MDNDSSRNSDEVGHDAPGSGVRVRTPAHPVAAQDAGPDAGRETGVVTKPPEGRGSAGLTERLAAASARRARRVLAIWGIAVVVALIFVGTSLRGLTTSAHVVGTTQSSQAEALYHQALGASAGQRPTDVIVVSSKSSTISDGSFQQFVARLAAQVRTAPGVTHVATDLSAGASLSRRPSRSPNRTAGRDRRRHQAGGERRPGSKRQRRVLGGRHRRPHGRERARSSIRRSASTSGSAPPVTRPAPKPHCARRASGAAVAGHAAGRRSAGPASPPPSTRSPAWSPRDCPIPRSASGCTYHVEPCRPTSRTCSPSWTSPLVLRSPSTCPAVGAASRRTPGTPPADNLATVRRR